MNIDLHKKDKKISNLTSTPKREEFKVPDGFFLNLEDEILGQIATEKKIIQSPKVWGKWSVALALVASIVWAVFYFQPSGTNNNCVSFACLYENIELNDSELQALEDESYNGLFEEDDSEFFDMEETEIF